MLEEDVDIYLYKEEEFTNLYNYVDALRQLVTRRGEGYLAVKDQMPDIDQRLNQNNTLKNYNDVIVECINCFPNIKNISREDMKYYGYRAYQLGSKKGIFPPTLEDVKNAKIKYWNQKQTDNEDLEK